ncbi:MAG: Wzt carbohydrate-binding domain-containing protein, partial [Propionivibrio sp.]
MLDEVLGVGDAYFAQKSYARMRQLTDDAGTTLLLVTHDIYSAVKLCDRLVWIDKGRVLMDGAGPDVIKAYEDSIRQQEESRLRLRKQRRLEADASSHQPRRAILEIQSVGNRPPASPIFFSRVALQSADREVLWPLGDHAFDQASPAHLEQEGTAWGETTRHEARTARPFLNYGSPFHKVAGVFPIGETSSGTQRIEIDYRADEPFEAVARLFIGETVIDLGQIDGQAGSWQTWTATIDNQSKAAVPSQVNTTGIHGTGAISITDIGTFNAAGDETYFFEHGGAFELRMAYRINQPDLRERPQLLLAFHRDGIQDVCRVITRDLLFDATVARSGEVRVRISDLRLGTGAYTVTVMVARERYYDEEQTRYFSLNPGVYACHSRALEINVTS